MKASHARILAPLLLIVLGIVLLIGCFPIPATRQLQPDSRPRPEYYVGHQNEKDKPVQVGRTKIDDAFIELSRRTGAAPAGLGWFATGAINQSPRQAPFHWLVSADRKQFALQYQVRVATWVIPLCFTAMQESQPRWLVLDVDSNGTVIAYKTVDIRPSLPSVELSRWLEIFDEPARRKLQSAGMLPPDETLKLAKEPPEVSRQRFEIPSPRRPIAPSTRGAEDFWRPGAAK